MLLAFVGTWSVENVLVAAVIICAAIGVAWLVMTKVFGVTPPPWLIHILWICFAAFVAIIAIRFLFTL